MKTTREIKANRVDAAMPRSIFGLVASCAVAGVVSLFASTVVVAVVAAVLMVAVVVLTVVYIETGFGCEE